MGLVQKRFVAKYRTEAILCGKNTGVHPHVILAQWAVETGWGGSVLAKCHNLAGIRYYGHPHTTDHNGFACYSSTSGFVYDYDHTMNLPYYAAVRAAKTPTTQCLKLGQSPWDAGHYMLHGVKGGSLIAAMNAMTPYFAV